MNTFTKILIFVWSLLSIASFICAFFLPTLPKFINLTFGGLNLMVIINYIVTYFQMKKVKNNLHKTLENDGMQLS